MPIRTVLFPPLLLVAVLAAPLMAQAATPPFVFPEGCCYLDGALVRTVVPPAATPDEGRDDFYAVMGGTPIRRASSRLVPVPPATTAATGSSLR